MSADFSSMSLLISPIKKASTKHKVAIGLLVSALFLVIITILIHVQVNSGCVNNKISQNSKRVLAHNLDERVNDKEEDDDQEEVEYELSEDETLNIYKDECRNDKEADDECGPSEDEMLENGLLRTVERNFKRIDVTSRNSTMTCPTYGLYNYSHDFFAMKDHVRSWQECGEWCKNYKKFNHYVCGCWLWTSANFTNRSWSGPNVCYLQHKCEMTHESNFVFSGMKSCNTVC